MQDPLSRAAYVLGQGARVGLYWGQYWLSARLTTPVKARKPIEGPMPDTRQVLVDLAKLMERDLENIEKGYYRMPHDLAASPFKALAQAGSYFSDLNKVEKRRHGRGGRDVLQTHPDSAALPNYYRQNFHFQTDGYLSRESAELYDHQVEVLFVGGADAMRRQALVPLYEIMKDRRQSETRLADIACGTGRFLSFVKDNYPRLKVTALDLSRPYVEKARDDLKAWRDVNYLVAPAEATGLAEASQDVVTCIYLFHELPKKVRPEVAREIARILKPGGKLIFIDSIQYGDRPEFDGLLSYFPVAFHEPYYIDYAKTDLTALFEEAGLEVEQVERVYFSRMMVLRKP